MGLAAVIEGLHERYATVDGIVLFLDYEPRAVQNTPLIYSLLDNLRRAPAGNMVQETYRIRSTVCLPWGDPEAAEASVQAFTDAIPAAVDAAPRLGGRAKDAIIQEADAGWRTINQVEFRVVDFYAVVLVYTPLGGA
jgi:hypothetical protein